MASCSSTRLTRTLLSPCRVQARCLTCSTARPDSGSRRTPTQHGEEGGLTGSDKLLADALRLEAEEEAALSKQSRTQDPNDPVWTGEERVQDTVLRMVMDKYKPLRIAHGANENGADEKIKSGIQVPSAPGPAPTTGEPFRMYLPPGQAGAHEDGRKLPKTPDAKPWRAVYVRPAHLLGGTAAEEFQPSIYYGQFIKSASSDVRGKLTAAGVNVDSLPVDDPKALSALRQNLKVAERRGKLLRARESVLDYQLAQSSSPSTSQEREGDEAKGDELSDTARNLQLQLGHAQGWDSVIERRIKAALDSGAFRENKLRGKPIQRDMEEKNPFLAREEYFMNRIVKRQGAAPPWVELNMELEAELSGWRGRFDEGWVRRASRMITTSSLRDGLEPLPLTATRTPGPDIPAATTPGEARLVDVATRYRDAEWEMRERSYHAHEIKRLNDLVRRHNHLAPFTARKGLMVLDVELAAMYKRTLPKLVYEVSRLLTQETAGGGARKEGWDAGVERGGVVTYDMWGREVRQDAGKNGEGERERWLDGWLGSGVSGGGAAKAGRGGDGRLGDAGRDEGVQSLGLVAAIQKSLAWARERLVRA